MKRFHLIFGLLLFVAFLLTGQYMDRFHEHLQGMSDGPRMLYRSRHIYILLAAMLNLGIGAYFGYRRESLHLTLQLVGSVLITIASVLFVYAFFQEPVLTNLYTPYSRRGIFMLVGGTLLHLISSLGSKPANAT
jgi:hypothetical protein